jgi:type II secretory pathway pseudopilin PulG
MISTFTAIIATLLAGAAGALAYGYRGQRDQEREQVNYLRDQLARARGEHGSLKMIPGQTGVRS